MSLVAADAQSTAPLAIPDPRKQPVAPGWLEAVALPVILETEDWEHLDEYEGRLRAFASYVESFDGDAVEFEKALRVVEKRRGDLLGPDVGAGFRTDLSMLGKVEASPTTMNRWRQLARHWEDLWPFVREAKDRRQVTQAALLRRIETGVYYSSETDDWETPQDLFDQLNAEFGFDLDVCASEANAKCERYFSADADGLAQEWAGVCWMNPPYGGVIAKWVKKASDSAKAGATVVCLVPARVDTAWWWDYCRFAEVRFLRGRLRFGGGDAGAPFPSAVVIFGRGPETIYWERAA